MKQRHFPCEFKAKDAGKFTGYAAVFGNVDQGFDVIEEGAFKEFVRNAAGLVKVLFNHRMGEPPIGLAEVSQDSKGLRVEGELVLADPIAARVHTGMKAGTLDGMSIGYDPLPGGAEITDAGVRRLKRLKLWEVSVVNFPMNPLALVDSVKTAGQICTIRDFEDFLRDEGGFSAAKAKALASGGWKALQQSARDEPDLAAAIQRHAAALAAL
jgi:HK97 family phage prohead protease